MLKACASCVNSGRDPRLAGGKYTPNEACVKAHEQALMPLGDADVSVTPQRAL